MRKFAISVITICFFYLFPLNISVFAETDSSVSVEEFLENTKTDVEEQQVEEEISTNSNGTFFDFGKAIIIFAIVIFLLIVTLKWLQKQSTKGRKQGALEVISSVALAQNKSMQLIKIDNEILVVGVAETITLMKHITNEEEVNRIIMQSNTKDSIGTSYGQEVIKTIKIQLDDLAESRKKITEKIGKKGDKNRE